MTTAAAPPVQAPSRPVSPWSVQQLGEGRARLRTSLHPGQAATMRSRARNTLMLAGTQGGKALALDTPIPTPNGWSTMGQIQVGDLVYDAAGAPTRVTHLSPIYLGNTCYRVTFDDGVSVVADAEHLWPTQTYVERKNLARRRPPNPAWNSRPQCAPGPTSGVRTTAEIASTLLDRRGAANHSVPICPGIQGNSSDFTVPPYTLGAWLGDGNSSSAMLTTADAEVLEAIGAEGIAVGEAKDVNAGLAKGYRLGPGAHRVRNALGQWDSDESLNSMLRDMGLLGNKHIPEPYLFGDREQRLALLQGLMDTDGSIQAKGRGARCQYTSVNPRLASDVATLVRGLGIKARVRSKIPRINGRPARLAYLVEFTTTQPVFRLRRKVKRLRARVRPDMRQRYVVAVEPVPSVPVRCIAVESPTATYLCTSAFITTHNTSLGPLWLEREIRTCGPGDYMAVTATFPLLKRKMLPEFLRLFKYTLNLGTWSSGDKMFTYHDGQTRVMFGTAKNPESLESATAKAAWLDECGQSQFRFEAHEAIVRRLSIFEGRMLMTSTPYNRGYLKGEVYDRAVAGDPDYQVVQFESTLNPLFPKAEMERVKRTQPLWKVRMFYMGLFDQPPGLIYSVFNDTYREMGGHLVHGATFPIPQWWPRYIGLDFGGSNTAKIYVAHDPMQEVYYIYKEVLSGGMTARQHAEEIKRDLGGAPLAGVWGGARSEGAWRMEFTQAGLVVQEQDMWDVEVGIDRGVGLFSDKRVFVFDTCSGFRDELGTYSRKVTPDGQVLPEIQDKNKFHRLDAYRAVASGLAGPPEPIPVLSLGRARGWQPASLR